MAGELQPGSVAGAVIFYLVILRRLVSSIAAGSILWSPVADMRCLYVCVCVCVFFKYQIIRQSIEHTITFISTILNCDIHGYIYFVLGCYKIIRPCILNLHYNFSTAVLGSHTHCHLQRGRRGVAEHGLVGPFPFLIHLLITAIFPLANTSPFALMMTFTIFTMSRCLSCLLPLHTPIFA